MYHRPGKDDYKMTVYHDKDDILAKVLWRCLETIFLAVFVVFFVLAIKGCAA